MREELCDTKRQAELPAEPQTDVLHRELSLHVSATAPKQKSARFWFMRKRLEGSPSHGGQDGVDEVEQSRQEGKDLKAKRDTVSPLSGGARWGPESCSTQTGATET